MLTYGLIGIPLTHSFSAAYFADKFKREAISDVQYKLFPMGNLSEFPDFISNNPGIRGLNVTIPYKQKIVRYLDEVDESARMIGAVNCIKITKFRELIGYNTDVFGFEESLKGFLGRKKTKALVLGNGGASRAVQYVLKNRGIEFTVVSRNPFASNQRNLIGYDALDAAAMKAHQLIIQTTPLGMHPNVLSSPAIPYEHIGSKHLLFDLVYNPEETAFLKLGKEAGAKTMNGTEMLHLQAERSWSIWQE